MAITTKSVSQISSQKGQGMVEYVVVLMFGVMVLTIGPGGDVLLDLLAVMHDNHQGYSYAASLSTLPQFDSLGEYVLDANGESITAVENKLNELYNMVPSSPTFEFPTDIPPSVNDLTDGLSFF
jgi:hypothetical protein